MAHFDPEATAALQKIAKLLDIVVTRALPIVAMFEEEITRQKAKQARWAAEEAARAADPHGPCSECGRPR